jgi:8-oxo-dGTP pyrophosphatase MutT (NUDIX family)
VSVVSQAALLSFDPEQVPAIAADDGLPAVGVAALLPGALRQRFATPPQWEPEVRAEPLFSQRKPALAAVLVPIVIRDSGAHLILTHRTMGLSTHAGQIAFPGGRVDAADYSVIDTALRETEEETGIVRAGIEVLGLLPDYVTGSAFTVTPVVALVRPDYRVNANPHEVAEVFEVPLGHLLNPACHFRHEYTFEGVKRQWYSIPYNDAAFQPARRRFIWGATAGMIRNFYHFLSAV